ETGQRTADEIDVVFYLAHLGAPGRAGLQIFGPQFAPPPGAEGAAGGQACGVVGPGSPRGEAWAGQKVTWREWFPVV
ncbi:hypothetical protein, partial [Actinophytocola sp.]|uniref:hypothetical protein n=1 Tax=Actinophytocola sp. TaxID=1872138 RepID=UPI002D7FD143